MKLLYLSLVFLMVGTTNANGQKKVSVLKINDSTYEVYCDISIKGDVSKNLLKYCWELSNTLKILEDKSVKVKYTQTDNLQTVDYDYTFMFLHYLSQYQRKLLPNEQKISFKQTKSESNIPYIPNVERCYGSYTITTNKVTTKMQYYQFIKCDGNLQDFYFNYIKNDLDSYFDKFLEEFTKNKNNAYN